MFTKAIERNAKTRGMTPVGHHPILKLSWEQCLRECRDSGESITRYVKASPPYQIGLVVNTTDDWNRLTIVPE